MSQWAEENHRTQTSQRKEENQRDQTNEE